MKWSIIVCTFNRAQDLQVVLSKLDLLSYAKTDYEIIVVDNSSTDNTANVVNSLKESMPNLRYVKEEIAGLAYARNRGIAEAQGEFVAFIDDDAWPELDWLERLEECYQNKFVACAGGMVKPSWERLTGWPEWLHERLTVFFTVKEHASHRKLRYPDYPVGTNISFRKIVLEQIGGFYIGLGRINDCLLSGEESEVCLRMEKSGHVIYYTPQAIVHHKVHESRMTKQWVLQRSHWQGISAAIIEKMHFEPMQLAVKCCKYTLLWFLMEISKSFFEVLANDKMSIFFNCQAIMCKSYLLKLYELYRAS